ncbi:heme-binding protein [Kribbella qitaiheensis]|uniref:Heme-binding protein n=1 Tax=Kribbella qitaiheensis TaxID=1544730 RepID=A0A7G6X521_9ACTN|nr:heme-binding protein [Kribbella qitaiheensis]QNE21336.1 heme-binding protein [Kribbella qitaiheensis]
MIALSAARTVVDGVLAHARAARFPPMTVAVLDAAGQLVAFAREDDSSLLRERIARGKARGALNLGVGSRSLAGKAAAHPAFIGAVTSLADGELVPVPGGVLVRDGAGVLLGAIGVSGHHPDADEACALAGAEAAGLVAEPGED